MTISATIFRSAAANGRRLPSLRSIGWVSPLPPAAWKRPSCSSGSVAAPLSPISSRVLWPLPTAEAVADDVDDLYRGLLSRADAREPRGGYNAGWRCHSCRRFVGGPEATCGSCGERHGGVFHEAIATR